MIVYSVLFLVGRATSLRLSRIPRVEDACPCAAPQELQCIYYDHCIGTASFFLFFFGEITQKTITNPSLACFPELSHKRFMSGMREGESRFWSRVTTSFQVLYQEYLSRKKRTGLELQQVPFSIRYTWCLVTF
jgi:hypothetical protein